MTLFEYVEYEGYDCESCNLALAEYTVDTPDGKMYVCRRCASAEEKELDAALERERDKRRELGG